MPRYFLRGRRFIVHHVLHADDTPHAIALGAAIAMFIAFLPMIGLQMIISVALAALFRANKAVCIPIVWITNPFTAIPIFYPCFVLGRWVLASPDAPDSREVLNRLANSGSKAGLLQLRFWEDLFFNLLGLGTELWVGSAIVAAVLAILSYPFARWAVVAYRERHRRRILERSLFRSKLAATKIARCSEVV